MKTTQGSKESAQASRDSTNEKANEKENDKLNTTEAPITDSSSVSATSNDSKRVSPQDIEFVQNLIERCLQLYMNRDEAVKTLLTRARIDPGFTTLVWQKLEEENADFFRAYYIRLKLKKQILLFNHLLEHQYHLMKYPMPPKVSLTPIQNGIHPMPGTVVPFLQNAYSYFAVNNNNLPMGYPVLQQSMAPVPGQPLVDTMSNGISSCHIVNGVPAPSNYHPIRMNSGNEALSSMSEIPVSPTSVASSGHFPFSASEISGIGAETSNLEAVFTSDVANSVGLQLPPDGTDGNSRDPFRSLDQIQWNFSLSDLTADLSNLGDLGALGNYPGSPFLPSDSDILLNSPENEDLVEEFFVDSVPEQPCSQSDEEKT
ncbi:hypothetical protein SDJN02_24004 [Cucurbita argyrosperma subsp. argyrosperma]|nr:hypothetical protein SDJN02_24004 [Cucurbita argyrosperma subsp. argyrosperma]